MDIDKKMLRAIKKECREMAREMTREHYKLYDDIWDTRIRITQELRAHGSGTIRDINALMPNLLIHSPLADPIDLVAKRYNFESTSDLVDFLLAYTPRGPVEYHFYEQLLAEHLGEYEPPAKQTEVDEVPF